MAIRFLNDYSFSNIYSVYSILRAFIYIYTEIFHPTGIDTRDCMIFPAVSPRGVARRYAKTDFHGSSPFLAGSSRHENGAEAVRGCPWRGTLGSMSAGAPFSGLPFLAGESVASFLLNINALFCWSRPASAGHSRSPSNRFVGLVVFFLFVGPSCA